jgi:hypothetical protein
MRAWSMTVMFGLICSALVVGESRRTEQQKPQPLVHVFSVR